MRIVEEANLYGIFIKSVRIDPFQLGVVGCRGDLFHVYATYGTREQQWTVKICITRHAGRLLYVSGSVKKNKKVPKIPPLDVGDLALPDDKEVVEGTFDDYVGGLLLKKSIADDIVDNEDSKVVGEPNLTLISR